MADSNQIKTAIADILRSVTGIGNVLERDVFINRDAELKAAYVVDGRVNAWVIRRVSCSRRVSRDGIVKEITGWTIKGYLSYSDDNQSEAVMDDIVNATFNVFDENIKLDGTVDTIIVNDDLGPQLEESSQVMLVGKLCDKVTIKLNTLNYDQIEE